MVLDHGTTTVRYAPAPVAVDLKDVSREVVMDANAWTYEVMTKELMREGKIVADAPTGQGTIPDPRRYVIPRRLRRGREQRHRRQCER